MSNRKPDAPRRACRYGHEYPVAATTPGRHRVCQVCQAAKKPKLCTAPSCPLKHYSKGHCRLHYVRLRDYGSLDAPAVPSVSERFWAKVNKNGSVPEGQPDLGPCWVWGSYTSGPPPSFNLGDRTMSARRWAWIDANGAESAEGLAVIALCRNKGCVRLSHLAVGDDDAKARNSSWSMQTHCLRGHEFTPENTHVKNGNHRQCRACRRNRANQWRQDNPDLARKRSNRSYLRRGGDARGFFYTEILRADPCSYCGATTEHIDHIRPLNLGGDSSWDNLTAACASCNSGKRDKPLLAYLLHRLSV